VSDPDPRGGTGCPRAPAPGAGPAAGRRPASPGAPAAAAAGLRSSPAADPARPIHPR